MDYVHQGFNLTKDGRKSWQDAVAAVAKIAPGTRTILEGFKGPEPSSCRQFYHLLEMTEDLIRCLQWVTESDGAIVVPSDYQSSLDLASAQSEALVQAQIISGLPEKFPCRPIIALSNAVKSLRSADTYLRVERNPRPDIDLDNAWRWIRTSMRDRDDILIVVGGSLNSVGIRRRGEQYLASQRIMGCWESHNGGRPDPWRVLAHTWILKENPIEVPPGLFADAVALPMGSWEKWVLPHELGR